jgi:outer membrane protease
MTQEFHVLKAGLNYRWGGDPNARWNNPFAAGAVAKAAPALTAGWEFDAGARFWYSSGKHQWASVPVGDIALSRLTYDKMMGPSGEVFARVDTPANVFVKGFFGLGNISRGKMNDEDWGLTNGPTFIAYSNAELNPIHGSTVYGTADIGYNVLRGDGYKVGVFAGYNYFRESMDGYGCTQMTTPGSGICSPPLSPSLLVISQVATWQSLRIGFAAEVMLTERLKLGGDVAYLPYAKFDGIDYHWLRSIEAPQWGTGQGVQTELVATYRLTNNFNVGIGGRYWAMWTTEGHIRTAQFNANTERYGVFVQGNYAFAAAR